MGSFFSQDNQSPQPAPSSVSTREQFAPATGATATPSGPQVGKAQGAGQAPRYTNLQQFLSGQSQDQVNSEVNPLVDKAAKLSQATTDASASAAAQTKAAASAGTDTGGVFGNTATSGGTSTPASASTPTSPGIGGLLSAAGNNASGTGVTVTTPAGDPSYDFSKVNLAGYQGPSTADVGGTFGAAQSASAAAQANASGLASGTPSYNAFDNAAISTNPGAWSKLQASLTGENQAVANAGAQQAGAVQGVNQAQLASGNSVTQQKSDLGAISGSAASTAATSTANATALATKLSSADPADVRSALTDPSLQKVGLDSAYAQQLQAGLSNGSLSPQQVQTALAPYVSALKSSTGYSATGASNFNQANKLLGTGQTASASATVVAPRGVTQSTQAANNTDISTAKDALTKGSAAQKTLDNSATAAKADPDATRNAQNQRAGAAIKDLLSKGYTPEQLSQMLGIPVTQVNSLSNGAKFALTSNSVGSAVSKVGKQ